MGQNQKPINVVQVLEIEMKQYSPLTIVSYLMGPMLIIVSHIGSLLVFTTGLSWGSVLWIVWLYLIRMLATTGIYHRLLTHKSYQAPALVLWIGSMIGASAGQMGPNWWKAHHLAHHQHADGDLDPHSPCTPDRGLKGFWWSQAGWLLSSKFFPAKLPIDAERDLVLKAIDRLHFVPVFALAAISYYLGGIEYLGAFCLSTTLLFHGVATVNSLTHLIGEQPFTTDDFSRNNWFVAVITLGEGWHNLHHAFPSSSRHGITIRAGKVVYLPDPTFSFIKLLEAWQLASKLRVPSSKDLLARAKHLNFQPLDLPEAVKTSLNS
jgi:stearoyl-CoA desaturase (Delta-9 desaturase)